MGEDEKASDSVAENAAEAVDITPDKDGGVLKLIKTAGDKDGGHALPGDKVSVHYVGTLTDGTKFDSSRDRGEYFAFTLGQGEVIKAWDLGVASMTRGELCELTCREDYAYGERGSPPTIPPGATLKFEIELFSWKGEDLSPEKDEGIIRSIIEKGTGFQNPTEDATCEIHIVGSHNGREFDNRDATFTVGEGSEQDVVPGIEFALKKFIKGERSKLVIRSDYAFGRTGHAEFGIPPGADIQYEVTLKAFEKGKESWEMDGPEKLEQATISKQKGTEYFKEGKYTLAVRCYKKVVDYLDKEDSLSGEEGSQRATLLLAGHLNLAMCYLKQEDNLVAMEQCDKALELDASSEKALFRRATALMNQQNYEEALVDFQKVLDLDSGNKAAKNQSTIARTKIKQEATREKKLYSGMFQKFADADKKREAEEKANIPNLVVNEWSNSMADGMMTLQQEAEAFGETMADVQFNQDECKENIDPRG